MIYLDGKALMQLKQTKQQQYIAMLLRFRQLTCIVKLVLNDGRLENSSSTGSCERMGGESHLQTILWYRRYCLNLDHQNALGTSLGSFRQSAERDLIARTRLQAGYK